MKKQGIDQCMTRVTKVCARGDYVQCMTKAWKVHMARCVKYTTNDPNMFLMRKHEKPQKFGTHWSPNK